MNPFQEVSILVKLNKVWSEEQKLMRLKLSTSTMIQMLAGGVQVLNIVEPIMSPANKVYLAAAIGIVQVAINTISHLSNPDGTDSKVAYTPPDKK